MGSEDGWELWGLVRPSPISHPKQSVFHVTNRKKAHTSLLCKKRTPNGNDFNHRNLGYLEGSPFKRDLSSREKEVF